MLLSLIQTSFLNYFSWIFLGFFFINSNKRFIFSHFFRAMNRSRSFFDSNQTGFFYISDRHRVYRYYCVLLLYRQTQPRFLPIFVVFRSSVRLDEAGTRQAEVVILRRAHLGGGGL